MDRFFYDLATIHVLWSRDLKQFFRQPSRIIGALGQPIIFWFVIGSGMTSTFKISNLNIDYLEYFFPGVVMMILLFSSIFAAVNIIDDRHKGFLQSVLIGPGSHMSMIIGKSLGASSVAILQSLLFFAFAPLAGFDIFQINFFLLISTLVFTSLGLTAMGFSAAWILDNVSAYHAIQMTLLIPIWILSGSMFPASPTPSILSTLMYYNPIAYAMSALRHALYGNNAPTSIVLTSNPLSELGIVCIFTCIMLILAFFVCKKRY